MYTNADNLINKRSELLTMISETKTLSKHTYLPINECELQVHDYDSFSNTTDSNCHRGIVIYMKKYLNATSFCINQNRLKEYSCCKIVLRTKPSYILFACIDLQDSPIDKNDLLN